MKRENILFRIKNFRWLLLLLCVTFFVSGCTVLTPLVVTNDRPYAVTVYEKYKGWDGLTNILEVGIVPAKQTKDFGRVLNGGDKQGKHTFELRNAQDKIIEQVTATEDEETHDVVNLHISR